MAWHRRTQALVALVVLATLTALGVGLAAWAYTRIGRTPAKKPYSLRTRTR